MSNAGRFATILSLLVLCSSCARSSVGLRVQRSKRIEELKQQLAEAQKELDAAQTAFAEALEPNPAEQVRSDPMPPEDARVWEQLNTVVDLSMLTPDTPFGDAIEIVQNLVEPPLDIVVIWSDLANNADVEPNTPIDIEGIRRVELGVALDRVLESVGGGLYELGYWVEGGVVTAATVEALPAGRMETRIYHIPAALRAAIPPDRLASALMEGASPVTWYELSDTGEGTITPFGETEFIVVQEPKVHRQIQDLLAAMSSQLAVALPIGASEDALAEQMRLLLPYADRFTSLPVPQEDAGLLTAELSRIISDLEDIRCEITRTDPNSAQLDELASLINYVRVLLAGSCESGYSQGLGSPPPSWADFGLWQLDARKAVFRDVRRRIDEIHMRLIGPEFFDPEVHQIRLAARRLKLAQDRVHDLHVQIADLSVPAATMRKTALQEYP